MARGRLHLTTHSTLQPWSRFKTLLRASVLGLLWLLSLTLTSLVRADSASVLYDRFRGSVFQIQVIDKGSANKTSIGSGFLLDQQGLIATNYHVVSAYIHQPEQYQVRLLEQRKGLVDAELIAFDVVHDLALLRVPDLTAAPAFNLADQVPEKGDRIYALGNPLDLAMTIIEGIHNGPVESARYQQFLFSGSLNSGMSGGPALNAEGKVIGINVAKGQEQISFLVPVHFLSRLIENIPSTLSADNYQEVIEADVRAHLRDYYNNILSDPWPLEPLRVYRLPDSLDNTVKCWGHTLQKDKALYDEIHRHCQTQDSIYVSQDLSIGYFSYDYSYLQADGLNSIQFYNLLAQDFSADGFHNATQSQVSTISCRDHFLQHAVGKWRVSTCLRRYHHFEDLYDSTLVAQRIDQPLSSLRINVTLAGISLAHLKQMHSRFLEQVQWQK